MKQIMIFLIGLFLIGCASNKDNQLDFEKVFGINEQTFRINNRNDTVLIGQKGTHIIIPKNLISETLSDNDTFKVVLKEFYSKSDMILAGLSTTSNGKIIESSGMISLDIYLNTEEIKKINKSISMKFSNNKGIINYSVFEGDFTDKYINWRIDTLTDNHHIFYNMVVNGKPCNCDYTVDTIRLDSILWEKKYSQIDSIVTFTDSKDTFRYSGFNKIGLTQTNSNIEIVYNISKLGWINCDRFLNFTDLTNVKIKSNAKENPYYFLVFKDINSIMQNSMESEFVNVPIGQNVFLIGLENFGDKLYFGITDTIRIKSGMILEINFKESDIDYVKGQIKRIDK
jgi:hypothetical protein